MSRMEAPLVDALWHFRYRCRKRPHGLQRLALDPDSATLGVDLGDGVAETVFAEARWHDPVAYGVHTVGEVRLSRRRGSGLVEWPVDLGSEPEGTRLVAVLAGFEIDLGDRPIAGVSELSAFVGVPGAEGRTNAGVSVGSRRDPELEASMTLLVLAVPADRLEVHTPKSEGLRRGGFEPHQQPLASTIGPQTLRPLGVAGFSFHLSARRPDHPTPRRLRELGISVNGLVMRWHCSTANTLTRTTRVRATATVPCVVMQP